MAKEPKADKERRKNKRKSGEDIQKDDDGMHEEDVFLSQSNLEKGA
jgi:hypothetical protein